MSNHLSNDGKIGVTDIRQQNDLPQSEASDIKESKGKHDGKDVSTEEVQQRVPQDDSTSSKAENKREVSIIEDTTQKQKIDDFIGKMAAINSEDTSFIKIASAATLLSFSLAAIVCLAVALALTFVWPLVVPLAVAVVLSGVLIKYLSSSNTHNKQAAILIVTDFAKNLLEEHPDESYQQALDRLEELATSKEFYQKVQLFRKDLKHVGKRLSAYDKDAIKQTQELLTFMFDFIKQDLPEDKKIAFTEIQKQYLTTLLNNREIGKKFLDNIYCTKFAKKEQLNIFTASESEISEQEFIADAFYMGIQEYLGND